MDRQLLVNNITGAAKAAVAYGLPIVHSTVNVKTGLNKPPIPHRPQSPRKISDLRSHLDQLLENVEFRKAVEATGRKKLIMTALWTEACLTFPHLTRLRRVTRSMSLSMRSAAPQSPHMKQHCAASNRPAPS